MNLLKQAALILAFYVLAGVLLIIFNMYPCYECSYKRITYFCFIIVHALLLYFSFRLVKRTSKIYLIFTLPLALWSCIILLVNILWLIAPFVRYQ